MRGIPQGSSDDVGEVRSVGAWRWGLHPPGGDCYVACLEAQCAWRYVATARRSESSEHLAARVPRQAIHTAAALKFGLCRCDLCGV